MRRRTLISTALATVATPGGALLARGIQRFDPRLVGTWRSDKERTLATWKFKESATTEVRERIGRWFGKLTHRYTETTVFTEFEGETFSSRYWVRESGENFVVVEYKTKAGIESHRIFLDGDHHIFFFVGNNVEYFKRVEA